MLVDDGRHAAPLGEQVIDTGSDNIGHEFKLEQIEIESEPCEQLGSVRSQLSSRRREADAAARQSGGRAVALGASPLQARTHPTPDARYSAMTERFGAVAQQQLTCGQHVHVEITSRAEGIGILNHIRDWLPLVRAISAGSPFWAGLDTGYASYRSVLWGQWPTAGPTELFPDEAGYDRTIADLIATGAAIDEGMIYFDARLSARYPTIEIRVADVSADLDMSLLVAALCRALVHTAAADWQRGTAPLGTSSSVLRAASWRSARYGLSDSLVDPAANRLAPAWDVVGDLLEHVGSALRLAGDDDLVTQTLSRLRRDGSAADRQRRLANGADLSAVVSDAADLTLRE